jgi:hypothetical protein
MLVRGMLSLWALTFLQTLRIEITFFRGRSGTAKSVNRDIVGMSGGNPVSATRLPYSLYGMPYAVSFWSNAANNRRDV